MNGKLVYRYAFYALLFSMADSIVAFTLPIIAENHVKSLFLVGIILASSSFWDIVADLLFGSILKIKSYFSFGLLACALAIALLIGNILITSTLVILVSMILWGFYFEAEGFSSYKFVHRFVSPESEAVSFSIMQQTRAMGYLIGPLIAGSTILISHKLTLFSGFLIVVVAAIVLISLNKKAKSMHIQTETIKPRRVKITFRNEISMWRKLFKEALPVILILFAYGVVEGGMFSFLPVMLEQNVSLRIYAGAIVASYSLGTILFSGLLGKLTTIKTQTIMLIAGTTLSGVGLTFLGFSYSPFLSWITTFAIGIGTSMFLPAIQTKVEHLCRKHEKTENEVLGETSAMWNAGFIIGTLAVGWISEYTKSFGYAYAATGIILVLATTMYLLSLYKDTKNFYAN